MLVVVVPSLAERMRISADLDPPQTFALRADEILGSAGETTPRPTHTLQH